ncbi:MULTISPECIES: BLUF domain-containing protein [Rhodomicrobium]|uniref:BLUF domain-containing protein n=1 Tax=Rhodomicrobium TaxID=1068 RepID=UPI000B4A8E3C|nr:MULTISPECIES: BLUF domain-containing protein [Rhodomicrobium]
MEHPHATADAGESGLHRICYVSSARGEIGVQGLVELLDVSRDRNQVAGLTGLLLYHDGNFMQALEGPDQAVRKMFEWIKTDPRHTGLIQMQGRDVGARMFRRWLMAFRPVDQLATDQRREFLDIRQIARQFGPGGKDREETAILIESFLSSFRDLH